MNDLAPKEKPDPVETIVEYVVIFYAVEIGWPPTDTIPAQEMCWLSHDTLGHATERLADLLLAIKNGDDEQQRYVCKLAHAFRRPFLVSVDTTVYRRVITRRFDPILSYSLPPTI